MAFMYGKGQPCIVKYVYKRQHVPDINIFKIWEKLIWSNSSLSAK